ncbi:MULTISPECIES: protein-L-isoaspartate(D-aspartate) O-methyltransferase [unclassified Caballeronia]|uniref:protein-L-isoaspartate(D-aspartate) O-methyltransferase n=1 Tax=unclassified Caballeronia TaxID=2646786 RepID=UPI002859C3A0|nr:MULTISPECIES: protein-L-isoaspartate(D-aspartate) O-methyltransferase [unclassified Caballeronia]MDR5750836.1 protein-L-isoaspartate(D-aspartate) O-methyltransferase [Caballeronia sp. LZ024]MDR5842131.1 protein-L-isoaspartate(D-aspartate) O-methyltransferase [Caballeronia sp. LZ031]
MTDERAKRFPLALADLVREPKKPGARPNEVRAKAATAVSSALRSVPGVGAVNSATQKSRTGKPVVAVQAAVKPAKPTVPRTANPASVVATRTPLRTVAPAAPASPRVASAVAHQLPGALRAAPRQNEHREATASTANVKRGAPNVALNTAHALTSERVRERMVERLRANGIADARVLNAMSVVPRHMFVDPGLAAQAYEDAALPIGHHQTISKPSVVARMIELVAAGRSLAKVLEIGTGCGYQAAVLSQVATEVYSIERVRPLSERAKLNLRPLRVPNIRLHYGDGRLGLPPAAPFDAIVIACAGLCVPQALLEQLAVGGRLVAPVGSQDAQSQVLTLVERVSPTQWRKSQLDRVFFVPLKSGVI